MNENRFDDDGSLNDRRHKADHHELGKMLDDARMRKELIHAIRDKLITAGVMFTATAIAGILLIGVKETIIGWLK